MTVCQPLGSYGKVVFNVLQKMLIDFHRLRYAVFKLTFLTSVSQTDSKYQNMQHQLTSCLLSTQPHWLESDIFKPIHESMRCWPIWNHGNITLESQTEWKQYMILKMLWQSVPVSIHLSVPLHLHAFIHPSIHLFISLSFALFLGHVSQDIYCKCNIRLNVLGSTIHGFLCSTMSSWWNLSDAIDSRFK